MWIADDALICFDFFMGFPVTAIAVIAPDPQ
jgi:hypothetical protein